MPLGFQIRVGKQQCGGHNLPSPIVGKGLTELLNSMWAKAQPAHVPFNGITELGKKEIRLLHDNLAQQ